MYSISDYASMIQDRVRTEAYLAALERVITPGCVVVEIGTGVGFFAVMAARMGAGRIYAIEPDDSIHVAREVAALNGCEDRIEFIQALSTAVDLPAQADVLLSDLRGVLPMLTAHVPSIVDARTRLLKPGGAQIPSEDRLFMALVETEEGYQNHMRNSDPAPNGVDFAPLHRRIANTWRKYRVKAEHLLSPAAEWARLDYRTVTDPNVSGEVELTASRDGTAHGVSAWFATELLPGIGFTNAPGEPEAIYGHAFFPFPHPISLRAGDSVRVELAARRLSEDYVWRWKGRVLSGAAEGTTFQQSTFLANAVGPELLQKSSSRFKPRANQDAAIDAWLLSRMDATRAVEEIATEASARFPTTFPSVHDALTRVGELSVRYSE